MRETRVQSLNREDPLEKEMATHSSTLAWKIPWMEEPGRLQSMGSQRVGHTTERLHFHFMTKLLSGEQGRAGRFGAEGPAGAKPYRTEDTRSSSEWPENSSVESIALYCVGRRGDMRLSTQKVTEAVPGVKAERKSRRARQQHCPQRGASS